MPRTNEATGETKRTARHVQRELNALTQLARDHPEAVDDPAIADRVSHLFEFGFGGDRERARRELARQYLLRNGELEKVKKALDGLKEPMYTPAWALSDPTIYRNNGVAHKVVQAMPITGSRPSPPRYFKYLQDPFSGNGGAADGSPVRAVPYLALVDVNSGLFISSLDEQGLPQLLMFSEEMQVSSVDPETHIPGIGRLKVDDPEGSRGKTIVFCSENLARQTHEKLESGEAVAVEVACGVAERISESEKKEYQEFVRFVDVDKIPRLGEMVWTAKLYKGFQKDIRYSMKNRTVCVDCVGPTGVGKTEGVFRAAGEAARARKAKQLAFFDISPTAAGTPLVHQYARNMANAFRMAEKYARDPNFHCAITMDEGDDVLAQADGHTYAHNDEERFALQRLLTTLAGGLMFYMTRNLRRARSLPPEIAGRFKTRVFPVPNRQTVSQVASLYCSPDVAARFGLTKDTFGERLADNMFSAQRVLGTACFDSGHRLPVRVSDFHQLVAPRNVKNIVQEFCWDVEDGEVDSIEALFCQVDALRVPDLNVRNFWELTTIRRPGDDTLRDVELNSA